MVSTTTFLPFRDRNASILDQKELVVCPKSYYYTCIVVSYYSQRNQLMPLCRDKKKIKQLKIQQDLILFPPHASRKIVKSR